MVDLGAGATPDQMAWVVQACSGALSDGRCVPEGSGEDASSPEAVAIVRVKDTKGRSIRIEVGRRREARASWSVREIDFDADDPPWERWRSVGLALATLVGEIEQARIEAEAEAQSSETSTELALPIPSPLAIVPEADDASQEPEAPGAITEPLARPHAFLGLGALAGQGTEAHPLRWGGNLRLGWVFDSSLQVSLSGDYSRLTTEPELELDWLRLAAKVGYRYFVTDRWSFGGALGLGARGLGIEARDGEGTQSRREWSMLGVVSADTWYQLASFGGLWLDLELSSIGRRTRFIARDGSVGSEQLPLGDVAASFGVWFTP